MIRHISFDLWLTLIKSHPEFKERRAEYLKKEFNPHHLSVREIMEIVRNTDQVCDRLNEINGQKVPTDQMYLRILQKLGYDAEMISNELLVMIKSTVKTMFLSLPPLFLNNSIQPMLRILKGEGYGLNIGSNTGFIDGYTIVETLKNLNIGEYFDFCIFSDEIGASKPSSNFFEKILDQTGVEKEEVLHVGDNGKADYQGALKFGFKALHIINQSYTINDIKRHLYKNS